VANMEIETIGTLLVGARGSEKRPSQHTFRDRDKSLELGRSYVSTLRSPARRVLRGGGEVNPEATAMLSEEPERLDTSVSHHSPALPPLSSSIG